MKYLNRWILSVALFAAPFAQADNVEQALQQCVERYIKTHIAMQSDRDELVSQSLVNCQSVQNAYIGTVIMRLLALDVPPRDHVRGLAITHGIKTTLLWANNSVDALAAI